MRDSDVRSAILDHLWAKHADDANTRIVQEMNVWSGTVRIDLAVINGELTGFEIKSERDTLARLPLQADIYSRVFDRVTLVVGKKHALKARNVIPKWWGVTIAILRFGKVELRPVRKAKVNPRRDPYLVAELLSKAEALYILESHGLARGWRSKKTRAIYARMASELPFDVLASEVRSKLRARERTSGQVKPCNLDMPVHA